MTLLIPLWTGEDNRHPAFYDHGTQVCLRCPLHPDTCQEMVEPNGVRGRAHVPDCLLAYAVWMLDGDADKVLSAADDVARQIGNDKMFVALYEAAIDDLSEQQIRQKRPVKAYRGPVLELARAA
jgi:hypothetical protein